ncbi:MAG: ChbG/HpnK family deacetylase [Alphaproteobacteria bacterium]|nr:ChbG/HpnK family deacetylase [Alphaproteobacteria bacterium]
MTGVARTPVILCADDYALSPAVSRGIAELIGAGRLTATGCMTASPYWPEHAAWLAPVADDADIGVHLSLTTLSPLTAMPRTAPGGRAATFGALARAAWLRRLDAGECRAEFAAQLDAFEAALGRAPDFVDGHHHIQNLPGLREVVVGLVRDRYAGRGTYLRSGRERASAVLRRGESVGRALGLAVPGRALHRLARRAGVPVNDGFAGIYDLAPGRDFGALFRRFLVATRPRTLIMCHPGHVDDALRRLDSLTDQREAEYAFLMSDGFPAALEAASVRLARYAGAGG